MGLHTLPTEECSSLVVAPETRTTGFLAALLKRAKRQKKLWRELHEEAAAVVGEIELLGEQGVENACRVSEHHSFYWSRVTLSDQ